MKKQSYLLIIAITLLTIIHLGGCTIIKSIRVLKQGEIVEQNFKTSFPFEDRRETIVVKVKIKGNFYDFILDTGAPNAISKEAAEALGLETLLTRKVGDGVGNSSQIDFVNIEEMDIEGLTFRDIGTAVLDFSQSPEMQCFNVDGLLGANLMRKAIWQFDFENNMITVTSHRDSISIPEEHHVFRFFPETTGTPTVDLELGKVSDNLVAVDFGFHGYYLTSKKTFNKLRKKEVIENYAAGYGAKSASVFGRNYDSVFLAKVPLVKLDDLEYKNETIRFSGSRVKVLGLDYFKDFNVTIDWFEKELILAPIQERIPVSSLSFGFTPMYEDNKVLIGFIYNNSDLAEAGISLGDQILSIDEKDFEFVSNDDWCSIIFDGFIDKEKEEISLTVLTSEGEEKTIKLKKVDILSYKN